MDSCKGHRVTCQLYTAESSTLLAKSLPPQCTHAWQFTLLVDFQGKLRAQMLQMPVGCLFRSQLTLTGPRLAARFWVRRVHWAGASLQESGTAVPVED